MGRILQDNGIEAQMLDRVKLRGKVAASAANEVRSDVQKKIVDRAIKDYYDEFSPDLYQRQYSLYDAFDVKAYPYGNGIGVEIRGYSSRLPQHFSSSKLHQSGGDWISRGSSSFNWSGGNGVPQNDWIFSKFTEGIHPRYKLGDGGKVYNESITGTPFKERATNYTWEYARGELKQTIMKYIMKNI